MTKKTSENKNNFSNLGTLKVEIANLQSFGQNVRSLKKDLTLIYNKSYNLAQNRKKAQKLEEDKKHVEEKPKKEQIVVAPVEETQPVVVEKKAPVQDTQSTKQFNNEKRIYYPKNNYEQRPRFNNSNGYQQNRQGNYSNDKRNGNFPNRPNTFNRNYQGNRPAGTGSFNKPGFNNNRPNFNPNYNNNRPYTPRPGFNKKTTLEPLPDFIKNTTNKAENRKEKKFENNGEKKTLSLKQKMRFGLLADALSNDERMGSRKLKGKKEKNEAQVAQLITNAVITTDNLTVKSLSETISRPASEIIKQLMLLGTMKTINSPLDFETAELVASELGVTIEKKVEKSFEEKMKDLRKTNEDTTLRRPPIVTVMGHVDHGKTSLLDAIRKTNVIAGEAGGITQHIGAYSIVYEGEKITFIDTPGHAAFSKMRARGAQVTDIAILIVAANDGIMPQTVESINQIKLAGVPMIVAINKIDLPDANIEKVKQQLTQYEIIPEEWGGNTICVPISAKNALGIDELIKMILLVSEVGELKADPKKDGEGSVLEAKMDKTRGPLANIIVQDGTLEVGDNLIAGTAFGKIRAMFDDKGNSIKKAGPSTPVSVLGLDGVPSAGDYFYAVDEKLSKQVIEERKNKIKLDRIKKASTSIDDFYARVDDSKLKHFNVIIKSDVQGSAEALEASLVTLSNEEIRVNCISASAGSITENDIDMAESSDAIIVAFNIKVDAKIETLAKRKKVVIKNYKIIYTVIDEIEQMIKNLKDPVYKEKYLGRAEVRVVFKLTSGVVAGSYVLDGKMERNAKARVIRDGQEIANGTIETLKIQKDDKKEVAFGFECGIKISGINDYKEKDIVECYVLEQIKE